MEEKNQFWQICQIVILSVWRLYYDWNVEKIQNIHHFITVIRSGMYLTVIINFFSVQRTSCVAFIISAAGILRMFCLWEEKQKVLNNQHYCQVKLSCILCVFSCPHFVVAATTFPSTLLILANNFYIFVKIFEQEEEEDGCEIFFFLSSNLGPVISVSRTWHFRVSRQKLF